MDGRTDNGPWLYYKHTNESKGSGELIKRSSMLSSLLVSLLYVCGHLIRLVAYTFHEKKIESFILNLFSDIKSVTYLTNL